MSSAASSTWSQMSSSTVASRYMSSRSSGVTNVRLRRPITSCVSRSPSCSSSRMSRSRSRFSGQSSSSSTSSRAISRAFAEACVNKSKKPRFCGVRRRRAMPGGFYRIAEVENGLGDSAEALARGGGRRRPRRDEGDRRREACAEAVDGERRQRSRLEEAHQEAGCEIGGRGRADGGDERLPAHAVAVVTEELRQLQDGGGADDRRREQEREPCRVLVREADEQPAAHRGAGAREAG